jgi:Domain of unknown function (DUF3859)
LSDCPFRVGGVLSPEAESFHRHNFVTRMTPILFAIPLVALAACDSGVKTSPNIRLVEYGTFKKLNSSSDVQAPGAIAGARHSVSKVELLEDTTNVIARVGTSFGLLVSMPGKPSDVVQCSAKCLHPKLTDPSTGRSSETEQWDTSGPGGQEGYIGYTLDNDWELVPGQWTFQVFAASKLAFEKTFTITASR